MAKIRKTLKEGKSLIPNPEMISMAKHAGIILRESVNEVEIDVIEVSEDDAYIAVKNAIADITNNLGNLKISDFPIVIDMLEDLLDVAKQTGKACLFESAGNDEDVTKFNWKKDTYNDGEIKKFKDAELPLNGIYEDEFGSIRHFKNGKYHNENGPSYIAKDGYKAYYINDKPHRIDGPAVIYPDGDYDWYINDNNIESEIMDDWLEDNDIPLDWNTWTESDKKKFANYWTKKYGTP